VDLEERTAMQETQKLRGLAEWCRDWADIGSKDDRVRSLSLAEFFDKRADDMDALKARAVLAAHVAGNRHPGVESSIRH
jgi:hypothetical protein